VYLPPNGTASGRIISVTPKAIRCVNYGNGLQRSSTVRIRAMFNERMQVIVTCNRVETTLPYVCEGYSYM